MDVVHGLTSGSPGIHADVKALDRRIDTQQRSPASLEQIINRQALGPIKVEILSHMSPCDDERVTTRNRKPVFDCKGKFVFLDDARIGLTEHTTCVPVIEASENCAEVRVVSVTLLSIAGLAKDLEVPQIV